MAFQDDGHALHIPPCSSTDLAKSHGSFIILIGVIPTMCAVGYYLWVDYIPAPDHDAADN